LILVFGITVVGPEDAEVLIHRLTVNAA
jgi:hypothetical protein